VVMSFLVSGVWKMFAAKTALNTATAAGIPVLTTEAAALAATTAATTAQTAATTAATARKNANTNLINSFGTAIKLIAFGGALILVAVAFRMFTEALNNLNSDDLAAKGAIFVVFVGSVMLAVKVLAPALAILAGSAGAVLPGLGILALILGVLIGALWLFGKAMQSVSEAWLEFVSGFEILNALDKDLPARIYALAGAMAALSAGGVASSAANFVSKGISAISGIFGGGSTDPIAKVKELVSALEDLDADSLREFNMFLEKMSSIGSIESNISSLSGAIRELVISLSFLENVNFGDMIVSIGQADSAKIIETTRLVQNISEFNKSSTTDSGAKEKILEKIGSTSPTTSAAPREKQPLELTINLDGKTFKTLIADFLKSEYNVNAT
jgi:hypothetical protein